MEVSKKGYLDNAGQLSSDLIIRQKEPSNLETPFNGIDFYFGHEGEYDVRAYARPQRQSPWHIHIFTRRKIGARPSQSQQ
jgi:hypothetical protein